MSLTNISQVLIRNLSSLTAKTPLFINLPEDGFINQYTTANPQCTLRCYNTHYIDYLDVNKKHGIEISGNFDALYQTTLTHDMVIISFPKSKAELAFTLAMIEPYLQKEAKIFFVGEKKGGVQSTPKLAQHFLPHIQKIDAARHCLLFGGLYEQQSDTSQPFNLNDWFKTYKISIEDIELTVASLPGVFSQQKLDVGTSLLLHNLPESMQGKVLDFGCGAGVISCFIGKKHHASPVDLSLLDVNALAIASAKQSLMLNKLTANVFASNSLSNVRGKYQHVVSNPPFHQGTKTSYQATEDFLKGIKQYMAPRGDITIVANSFLQYPQMMKECIGHTKTIKVKQGFSIHQSTL